MKPLNYKNVEPLDHVRISNARKLKHRPVKIANHVKIVKGGAEFNVPDTSEEQLDLLCNALVNLHVLQGRLNANQLLLEQHYAAAQTFRKQLIEMRRKAQQAEVDYEDFVAYLDKVEDVFSQHNLEMP
jgi:hypothetical protein